eukprot:g1385.t1
MNKKQYSDPTLCDGLDVWTVPIQIATEASLKGLGRLVKDPAAFTTEEKTFEIKKWPAQGWRSLDLETGDEAGTTEGSFDIYWAGDFLFGKNHSIATESNHYLLGYGKDPMKCKRKSRGRGPDTSPSHILLWYSDYHPDGGQLFYPKDGKPFVTNLAPASVGDDVRPRDFTAFYVPAGYGVYIHPGTWHNAVYTHPSFGKDRTFFNRQGRVHARVSVNWADEFGTLLRVPLVPPTSARM